MQQFILIRGHQGSGKTTFALEKIAEFKRHYPQAHIVHIENDLLLTDKQGHYHWSPEAVSQAQAKGKHMMLSACQSALKHPTTPLLIINSNTNQNASACLELIQLAQKHHLETQIYRLQNFFPNQHQVDEALVLSAYWRIQQHPLINETLIPAIQEMDDTWQQLFQQMLTIGQSALPFNPQTHSYVSEEYLRLGQLNFNISTSKRYPKLRLLKYARQIETEKRFDKALLEMNGLILDDKHHIIVRPLPKILSYAEHTMPNSDYPISIDQQRSLEVIIQPEGFLACCTYIALPNHHPNYYANFNHQILYSTAHSLDNPHARLTQTHCQAYQALFRAYPNHSFTFILNPKRLSAHLLSATQVATGKQIKQSTLDTLSKQHHIPRPKRLSNVHIAQLKSIAQHTSAKNLIILDADKQNILCCYR